MPNNLVPHPTWNIQDSSKIQTFMDCPRKYFYQYVLGWDSQSPAPYLTFGEGMHAGIEFLMNNGFSIDAVAGAYQAFLDVWREVYKEDSVPMLPDGSSGGGVYTPAHALITLSEYAEEYERDADAEVLYTEVAGTVPIDVSPDRTRVVYFRMDSILRIAGRIWSYEHKTTRQAGRTWIDKWDLSFQVGVYTHVLYSIFGPENVEGVKINAIVLAAPTKKDQDEGRLCGNKYFRVPQRRTMDMMNVWLWNANHWFDWIEHEFERLAKSSEGDTVMHAFPMNTESCTKYWGCPFRAFCTAWANPLRHADSVPIGFGQRWWNPQDRVDKAKQVVHLEDR